MSKKQKEYKVYKNVVIGLKRYVDRLQGGVIITSENGLYDLVRLVYEFRGSGYLVPLILYGLEIEENKGEYKLCSL